VAQGEALSSNPGAEKKQSNTKPRAVRTTGNEGPSRGSQDLRAAFRTPQLALDVHGEGLSNCHLTLFHPNPKTPGTGSKDWTESAVCTSPRVSLYVPT
jgi:hypothetical protein